MAQYENLNIQEMPMGSPLFRIKVERFLRGNGLAPEAVDAYYVIENPDGEILAGGGYHKDIIKCLAVAECARSEGLLAPVVSRLMREISLRGYSGCKVFTKPANRPVFESLGFHLLAEAPEALLMECGKGLVSYCRALQELANRHSTAKSVESAGVVVLHANPVTLGHQYLLQEAAGRCDHLFVIPLSADGGRFSAAERAEMLQAILPENATLCPASDYIISYATFPSYFLKKGGDIAETQMRLDLDLFARHIMPALGAAVRFVGSEADDPLTARYNALMQELLPGVEIIPRLQDESGRAISASRVRKALDEGSFTKAASMTPPSTHPYLKADLAARALRIELDLPLKPGLVGPDGAGAHKDMDYALMQRSIAALRPWFVRMAKAESPEELQQLGIDAEKAMLEATGGVNTHRGAIFALGLALYGRPIAETAAKLGLTPRPDGVNGALQMALGGYRELFNEWLPLYRRLLSGNATAALQQVLLRIMSTLDDTCIIKRVGPDRAQQVKREAADLLASGATLSEGLRRLCLAYADEGISPGGAADMLALTIFIDTITS